MPKISKLLLFFLRKAIVTIMEVISLVFVLGIWGVGATHTRFMPIPIMF